MLKFSWCLLSLMLFNATIFSRTKLIAVFGDMEVYSDKQPTKIVGYTIFFNNDSSFNVYDKNKMVANIDGVQVYSEKALKEVVSYKIFFTDSSWFNTETKESFNNGPGYIIFKSK